MVPANRDNPNLFDFLDSEVGYEPRQKDEVIASNLYYVSFPNALAFVAGTTDESKIKEMREQNNWLQSVIPEAQTVAVLNFDRIKEYLPDHQGLKSCDAFFYESDCAKKCFLIEFKATSKEKLLKLLDVDTDNRDAIIKKVTHSKVILQKVCFTQGEADDDVVSRTHIVVVYDGKNTIATPTVTRNLLPRKTKCTDGGRQQRASIQRATSKKEIDQPTKRFADYVQKKVGFCSVTKKELPGAAFPDDNPRFATFMTATDFAKAVDFLFKTWDWGDYTPYFSAAVGSTEKTLDPV